MHYQSQITAIKQTDRGTDLIIHIPGQQVRHEILKYRNGQVINAELKIDDNRTITLDQRKTIYATVKDISLYTGYEPEYLKDLITFEYCGLNGEEYFSLSNCSITKAKLFINHIINFVLEHDIPLSQLALERTDDIDAYLYMAIKHKRCCICGKPGEIEHIDTIGMGSSKEKFERRKACLCEEHRKEFESIGRDEFQKKHYVYGIIYNE